MRARVEALREALDEQRRAVDAIRRMRALLEWCWLQASEGRDIDGGGFQDIAATTGVLVKVPNADERMYKLAWKLTDEEWAMHMAEEEGE